MSWRNGTIFTIDCAAVFAGILIAAPFMMILSAPFLGAY
jgi:hypothetical protein